MAPKTKTAIFFLAFVLTIAHCDADFRVHENAGDPLVLPITCADHPPCTCACHSKAPFPGALRGQSLAATGESFRLEFAGFDVELTSTELNGTFNYSGGQALLVGGVILPALIAPILIWIGMTCQRVKGDLAAFFNNPRIGAFLRLGLAAAGQPGQAAAA